MTEDEKEKEIARKVKILAKKKEWQVLFNLLDDEDISLFKRMKGCKKEDSFKELQGMCKEVDWIRRKLNDLLEVET